MEELKHKILIVDDDEALRSANAEAFAAAGFEVLQAKDGLEGLNMANTNLPNVILTGIMMPGMTGFELIEALKKNVATSSIPCLVFSHLGREEDKKKSFDIGAADFLVKGMTPPKEIISRVNNMLSKKVFKIAIDPNQYDAQTLASRMNIPNNIVLELSENTNETGQINFTAQIINK